MSRFLILAILVVLVLGEPQYSQPIYEDSSNFELSGPLNLYDLNNNDRSRRNLDNSESVTMTSRPSQSTKGRGDSCDGVYCHPNARCHNGRCHCEFGYEGDAKHNCDKVDLCKKLGCHAFARCHDGRCRCDAGYSGDGYRECIRADSADSVKGISISDVTTLTPEVDPSTKGKGQTTQPPSTKGSPAPSEKSQITRIQDLISESNSTNADMFVGLPYSIDLLSFIPHPPAGDEFSNVYSTDGGSAWINYNSPRRPLPAPLPIRTVFPTSYMPRELIHPISFMVDFAPYERSRPGRSFLISRVDRHGRLRFAVALNQWGNHGEYMELWIHHDNFFTARYDPVMGLQYSGGLMPSTGIATIPLPRAEPGTQKSIKISLEMSDRDLQVFNGCPRDENRIFSLYYSPRQEMNLGKGPSPPAVSAKGKGQTDNNSETNDFTQDKIYLLSGGPVHNNRYKGLVRDMKLFFSRDGASRHCNFRLNEQPNSSGKGSTSNVVAPQRKGNNYDSVPLMPRSIPSSQPSYYPPTNAPSQFMGLDFEQSTSSKGGSQNELCVRVNPMKGDSVRIVKIPCN